MIKRGSPWKNNAEAAVKVDNRIRIFQHSIAKYLENYVLRILF